MNEAIPGLAPAAGYRHADQVNDALHVAGQVPLDAGGTLVGGLDPARQASQCLANLQTLVEFRGFCLEDVHHLTIYVVGPYEALLKAWDAVTTWFDGPVPPATLLGVTCLGYPDQLVEVDATIDRQV